MSRLHTLRDQEQVIQFVTHEIVELSTCAINYLGTNESGIDVNQHAKSGAKRQQLPSVGNIDILWDHKSIIMLVVFCIDLSEMDSDIMSSPDILSDEGTEDEGIGRNDRKHRGIIQSQAEGNKETMCVHQVINSVYMSFQLWYDVLLYNFRVCQC